MYLILCTCALYLTLSIPADPKKTARCVSALLQLDEALYLSYRREFFTVSPSKTMYFSNSPINVEKEPSPPNGRPEGTDRAADRSADGLRVWRQRGGFRAR